jgi:acetyltransferase-like isoleucine patch superfamily enzyme
VRIISGKKKIYIGRNFLCNSGIIFNPVGGNVTVLCTNGNGKIWIGNNVGVSNARIIASESITIDDDVMIGANCHIYDSDFHSLDYGMRMLNPDPNIRTAPVRIKRGAFIGAHSLILKGVTIGEEAVIGASSVVTHSVPDKEIWAGNPAKMIGKVSD